MLIEFNAKPLEYLIIKKVNYFNLTDLCKIFDIKSSKITYLLPRELYIIVKNTDIDLYKLSVSRRLNNRGERFLSEQGVSLILDKLNINNNEFLQFLKTKLKPKKRFFLI